MQLRMLDLKDAPYMLEWMHDECVIENLQSSFKTKTLKDCEEFISASLNDKGNVHLAIASDDDMYLGTVSLKHIRENTAEFAIAIRKSAMGKGVSKYAMREVIRMGFEDMNLKKIYWYVSPLNMRAIRFYEKNGYQRTDPSDLIMGGYTSSQVKEYLWYQVSKKAPDTEKETKL